MWSDLTGTIKTALRVGFRKAVIDAGGLSAERTFTLPNRDGTVALLENIKIGETPSGSINGSNDTFTLANTPIAATEQIFLNGELKREGAGKDYIISGNSITYLSPLEVGDWHIANYIF